MSNTGEGGEDEARFMRDDNGDLRRSAVKQVASGRFGVTTNYLVNADELQIKMAQGAKPGEGGQLPGHKVDEVIARMRHSIPGVGLISPPPHHDIYSIEDLAQLIYDLKNVNPQGAHRREAGGGSRAWARWPRACPRRMPTWCSSRGDNGGTGASPLSSIKHAGLPWELGLAETQQVLLLNDLRSRIRVQTDGKLQTGRDVVIAALLGAEEFGFATTPLITHGLHHDAQVPPEYVLGGHRHAGPGAARALHRPARARHQFLLLHRRAGARAHGEAGLPHRRRDGGPRRPARCRAGRRALEGEGHRPIVDSLLADAAFARGAAVHARRRTTGWTQALDHALIEQAQAALESQQPVAGTFTIRNVHRTVGAMLGGEIARRYGSAGLPDDTIHFVFTGSAGQSFGAFVPNGVTLELEGDSNDYVGKGLSGGRIIAYPPQDIELPAGREHPGRQRGAVWRDQRRSVPQRHRRRAIRGPQLGGDGGGRGCRRPWLRVHDQRHGRGDRHRRAATLPRA